MRLKRRPGPQWAGLVGQGRNRWAAWMVHVTLDPLDWTAGVSFDLADWPEVWVELVVPGVRLVVDVDPASAPVVLDELADWAGP